MLLAAELRKLARPAVWGAAIASVLFCVLLALGASDNARSGLQSPRISLSDARVSAAEARQQELPGSAGEVAIGMLASLPGVVVIALLAGAHVGGEWSGRTIRTLLTNEGRRLRVLAAKWVSLWIVAVVIALLCWVGLAIAGPILASAFKLPSAGTSLWAGLGTSEGQFARGVVVLGLFSLLGVAAGILTRNAVGAVALMVGAAVVFLVGGGIASLSRLSPALAVGAWMRFTFSGSYLPTNFWTRFEQGGGPLSSTAGLVGILATAVALGALSVWRMRADVTA